MYALAPVNESEVPDSAVDYSDLTTKEQSAFDRINARGGYVRDSDLPNVMERFPSYVVRNDTYYVLNDGMWDEFC